MSQEVVSALEEVNSTIHESLNEIKNLMALKESLELKRANKVNELNNEKEDLISQHVNQENLTERSEEIHRKFSILDVLTKKEADVIHEEKKNLMKFLNIKVTVEPSSEDKNYLEIKLELLDVERSYVTFVFDPATDDYELLSLNPPHKHFQTLKEFLQATGDVQGFLSNFRKYAKSVLASGHTS